MGEHEIEKAEKKAEKKDWFGPDSIGPNTLVTNSATVPDQPMTEAEMSAWREGMRSGTRTTVIPPGHILEGGAVQGGYYKESAPTLSHDAKVALGTALAHLLNGDDEAMWNKLLLLSEEDVVVAHNALGKLLMQVLAHGASFQLRRSFEEELTNKGK